MKGIADLASGIHIAATAKSTSSRKKLAMIRICDFKKHPRWEVRVYRRLQA